MSHSLTPARRYTIEEYLVAERASVEKHEYYDGDVVAMSGGSFRHAAVSSNLLYATAVSLKDKPCQVINSDLKVFVSSMRRFFYPDALVVCGEPIFDPSVPSDEYLTNPTIIFEVLSPSTADFDRTKKFNAYMQLESLQEYVLLSTEEPRIESYLRLGDGHWSFGFVEGLANALKLRSLDVLLPLAEIYAGVTFRDDSSDPRRR